MAEGIHTHITTSRMQEADATNLGAETPTKPNLAAPTEQGRSASSFLGDLSVTDSTQLGISFGLDTVSPGT